MRRKITKMLPLDTDLPIPRQSSAAAEDRTILLGSLSLKMISDRSRGSSDRVSSTSTVSRQEKILLPGRQRVHDLGPGRLDRRGAPQVGRADLNAGTRGCPLLQAFVVGQEWPVVPGIAVSN